jgi:hypothetical protein
MMHYDHVDSECQYEQLRGFTRQAVGEYDVMLEGIIRDLENTLTLLADLLKENVPTWEPNARDYHVKKKKSCPLLERLGSLEWEDGKREFLGRCLVRTRTV